LPQIYPSEEVGQESERGDKKMVMTEKWNDRKMGYGGNFSVGTCFCQTGRAFGEEMARVNC
jgi:hypothetical protein